MIFNVYICGEYKVTLGTRNIDDDGKQLIPTRFEVKLWIKGSGFMKIPDLFCKHYRSFDKAQRVYFQIVKHIRDNTIEFYLKKVGK